MAWKTVANGNAILTARTLTENNRYLKNAILKDPKFLVAVIPKLWELEELTWNVVKMFTPLPSSLPFCFRLESQFEFSPKTEHWVKGGGLGLLTTIHLLRVNVLLQQSLLSISFFDKMYSTTRL